MEQNIENMNLSKFSGGLTIENNDVIFTDTALNYSPVKEDQNIIDVDPTPKWKKALNLTKLVFGFISKHTFLYFANRLAFGLKALLSFNFILIGFVWFEWWAYSEAINGYAIPYLQQFFSM